MNDFNTIPKVTVTMDDDSPAAVLDRTRKAYTDTGKRIEQLRDERGRLAEEHKVAADAYRKRIDEITRELADARVAYIEWGRMLPRGDTARGNGTQ